MSHELGSLLGVSYRINMSTLVPETGFLNPTTRSLSFAFTTSAVVCLASFQLFIFIVCTWRISQAWDRTSQPVFVSATRGIGRGRSNSENTSYLGDEPGIRGLSWLALALALGATETLLSLGTQTFVLILIRRILRVFARGSLMYALVRGSSDGFSNLEEGKGIRGKISHPRASTFAQLTPRATAFYNQRNPFSDPSTPRSRVTVLYDQKSAPVLQMRFSGLDMSDSSQFRTRADSNQFRTRSGTLASTSVAAHGGHSTKSALTRSRTLSEKRSAPPLASIQIPSSAVLSGVVATQSASSTRSSLPPLPAGSQSRLALGSLNRSTSSHLNRSTSSHPNRTTSIQTTSDDPGSYEHNASLEGVRELAGQFPVIPPRTALRRGPTQLAYAVEEEDELVHSEGSTRSRRARPNTADSNLSNFSAMTASTARRKPVPAHTPGGTIIDLPSTNRPAQSNSGEQVVVETHSTLFSERDRDYYDYTSSRASSDETPTPSPAEILTGRPARLAKRVAQLERQRHLSGTEEHSWMRSSVPMSQSAVISRTPEVFDTADFESSRVEFGGVASPKSAFSARQSRSRGSMLGLNLSRPGSNVEGWGRKLSDTDPSQVPAYLRPGQDEFIRRSLVSTRRHESGSFVGDEPHAM
ncbi:hypothetical protein FRC11_010505 [Ceratobasidium sp. 423]|nr:hypothetical protein FRC11_010505 [Ceratobasidium sp. 423]